MFVGRENELKILIAYFHQTGKNLYWYMGEEELEKQNWSRKSSKILKGSIFKNASIKILK